MFTEPGHKKGRKWNEVRWWPGYGHMMSDQNPSGPPVPPPGTTPPGTPEPARKSRKPLILTLVVVAAVVIAILLYLFQPWALITGKEVNEDLPTATPGMTVSPSPGTTVNPPSVANVTLASGPFQSYEHTTTGKASLIQLPDGRTIVRLTDFQTSNGPDVKVWLSVNPAGDAENARDAKYVDLGDMKGNSGNQNYELPASAAGQTWGSVVIWCDRFSVPFGAATLTPAAPSPRS